MGKSGVFHLLEGGKGRSLKYHVRLCIAGTWSRQGRRRGQYSLSLSPPFSLVLPVLIKACRGCSLLLRQTSRSVPSHTLPSLLFPSRIPSSLHSPSTRHLLPTEGRQRPQVKHPITSRCTFISRPPHRPVPPVLYGVAPRRLGTNSCRPPGPPNPPKSTSFSALNHVGNRKRGRCLVSRRGL